MSKINFFITCFLFLSLCSIAADGKYPVSNIPEELKSNVNAVVRDYQLTFKIHSKSKASYYVHHVITILNEKSKHYAEEVVSYNKLSKIKDFNGTVYDANGKQIKKLKNSEIFDQSAYDGFSLYSDSRLKIVDLAQGAYPYTVEFEYEVDLKYLFYIPDFVLNSDEKISVEQASYSLQYPENSGLAPRYLVKNTNVVPQSSTASGYESLTWSFQNILPPKFEPHSSRENLVIRIIAAPSVFEYDSYSGTMKTWDEFGQWIISLNSGRNILSVATKQKIKQITDPLKSREEKVKAVYEYLQNKTRYVSIQLGIGGYQPFEASVVDETGYGDCKALSNYTVSLLESVGIKAHYVLIEAGENPSEFDEDFPSTQFNHAIVAVPNGADTLWLECTSQTNPFGYQGTFTGDRKALLITDRGAKVVNTTKYSADQNLQSRKGIVVVETSGDARATIETTYNGIQYENDNLHLRLANQYDEQRKWIQNNTDIPSFDINTFSMSDQKSKIPSAKVSLDLSLKRYATVNGKRTFLTPNLMNRSTYIPEKIDNRKTKVVRKMAYTDIDTIRYQMPEGVYPEFIPAAVKLSNRFGEYEATFKVDQGALLYVRKVKMNKGEFPVESYQELLDFYKGINKADNTKMVFMSKT
jgi:transglutaminase-like putative cysteine protease